MREPVTALESKLGYHFASPDLLVRALTHRSWSSDLPTPGDPSIDNEQLEFLGDSILGFVVSEALVAKNPSAQEGQLSQWKSQLVSSTHLYQCALALDLGRFLILGKGEEKNGGRERKALLADAMEAVIAAIHLDGGIEAARAFVHRHVVEPFEDADSVGLAALSNYKSTLQEKLQAMGLPPPRYTIVETSGPEHAKLFTVEAAVGDRFVGRATGTSKKTASQHAAHEVIQQLSQADSASQETYQDFKHVI
jgi:ribonuclease-3